MTALDPDQLARSLPQSVAEQYNEFLDEYEHKEERAGALSHIVERWVVEHSELSLDEVAPLMDALRLIRYQDEPLSLGEEVR